MAEIAVNIVIDKLIPLLRDEVKLLRDVHGQVRLVMGQLAMIRAYLKDADVKAEMAKPGDMEKEWVQQVREVAYSMEDVMDKYMFKVVKRRQRRGAVGPLSEVGSFIRTIMPRHEITSAIADIRESISSLNQIRDTLGLNIPSAPEARSDGLGVGVSTNHGLLLGAYVIKDAELVGVDGTRNLLTGWLLNGGSMRTVISVVGEGGLGKTTIVKDVYNKQKDKGSFDCYAWITMSSSFKGEHLLKTIIQSFYEEDDNKYATKESSESIVNDQTLIRKLSQYLQGRSYMIVFDDVWKIEFWRGVEYALPANNNSRIILTTRDMGVAEFCRCSDQDHIHELKPLSEEDALNLFLLTAFRNQIDRESYSARFMDLSQAFVQRCDRVPLAILAIARLLSTQPKIEWEKVYNSLRSKFSSDSHLKSYYQALSESYQHLPYHLKPCLLYFGLFPKNYSIGCSRLIRLWVAEGFVKENENEDDQITLEEEATEYLAELIRRSLVKVSQVYGHGRVRRCRVHDLMHDFIHKKCEELNFCQVMKSEEFKFGAWTRRLSIHKNNDIKSAKNYGRLRSCFVCDIEELPNLVVKSLFSCFKLLVILDFEDSPLDYLHKAVGNLLNLKYISVRKTKIKTIPKFIGNLQNLETLNLKDTEVRELPIEINRLAKLRHLLSYSSYPYVQSRKWLGVKLNEGIGRLTALQSLLMVDTTDGDGVIKELKNLKKMRRLGIINLSKNNGNHVCSAVKNMTNLCSLKIQAAQEHEVLDLQSLIDPPRYLRRLDLEGRLERLPKWIPKLNLVRLSLNWSGLAEDPLPVLKGMSELSELLLYGSYEGDELHFREGWFIELQCLTLRSMPGLRTLKIDGRALPHLEELQLGPCPQMAQVPTDIQNLEALKHLHLYEMPKGFVENIWTRKKENTTLHLNDMIIRSLRSL